MCSLFYSSLRVNNFKNFKLFIKHDSMGSILITMVTDSNQNLTFDRYK